MKENVRNDPHFFALRDKPLKHNFQKGDVLVLFGELFQRGYANGLVDLAESYQMTIVRTTVGRRDHDGNSRPLTQEEIDLIPQPFINISLEAGFDFELDQNGQCPNDYLKSVKLTEWTQAKIPDSTIQESLKNGQARFRASIKKFIVELEQIIRPAIESGRHIHFAHTMAGGVPRVKIVMPLMNRVFKGKEDRFLTSQEFLESNIGQFMLLNFNEITAKTFDILIEESTELRLKIEKHNGTVSYVAYGYHGTEIMVENDLRWQSYAPYIQGWAKVELENYSKKWSQLGVQCCVYNCPEILTNSSSIFKGVEIPLYNLIRSLQKIKPNHLMTKKITEDCQNILKNPDDLNLIFKAIDDYINFSEEVGTSQYKNWPQHSQKDQLAKTLQLSDYVVSLHQNENQLMTAVLSELIFKSCGFIMLHDGFKPKNSVSWIGHDAIVNCMD